MQVAIHGASGFTGRLTVAEVRRRGFTPVLVGRSEERLRSIAADGEAVRVAGLDEPGALAAAFEDCAVVINCAGPFTVLGEPVIRAAIAAGTHYLDTTGEQHYIRSILDGLDADAARAGVTVVPAMADDGGPGDMIAHLVAERVGPEVAEVLVADLRGRGVASRGTARSMAAVFGQGALAYTDGRWHPAEETSGSIAVPGEDGEVPVAVFALPGVVTIPRHVAARRVRSVIRTEAAAMFSALTPDVVDGVPEIPDEGGRRASRWLMLAEASGEDGKRVRGWVTGADPYGLTAVIAVEGARRLAVDGAAAGALTPAQAFGPASFLDHLTGHGVTWQVAPA
ncbi:NAD(P)H-binding protein [Nonomuraea sp. PA05]|uniref:saccharopine dehydrogenase family protein n=1 Tax=Nonomuraea sp. PA05 TaxID=2604466 RepID=UPI0011D8385D|nr:saccharopine dehydrogenase NADP-binding domain-containing protein [Nonomuraea sp. PA05]TYB66172.1 NAD(P)H-binding protein [Nonomuraea sp. PA05]